MGNYEAKTCLRRSFIPNYIAFSIKLTLIFITTINQTEREIKEIICKCYLQHKKYNSHDHPRKRIDLSRENHRKGSGICDFQHYLTNRYETEKIPRNPCFYEIHQDGRQSHIDKQRSDKQ